MNGFIGELFGTYVLIVLGTGACAGANLKQTYAKGSNWTFISVAWGMAVTMGVYVASSLGSLGHLNPAVTIPYAIFGLFPWNQVVPYLLGQFLGAFLGAATIMMIFYPHFRTTTVDNGNTVGIFATRPAIYSPVSNYLSEVVATFVFVFALLNLGDFTQGLKPLVVGLLIMVVGLGVGTTTGFALNRARDWGPRFAYSVIPVPNRGSGEWYYSWVPMFGPLTGGIIAAGLQVMVK